VKQALKNWLPAIVWASMIMLASTDTFSAEHTRSIIESFFWHIFPSWTPYSIYKAHLVVRKCAHFFEYAVLAIFVMRGFAGNADPSTRSTMSRSLPPQQLKTGVAGGPGVGIAFLRVVVVCAMVATIDEVHQHFVPSRTSSPYDVLLDTTGSTCAMLLLTWKKSSRAAQRTA